MLKDKRENRAKFHLFNGGGRPSTEFTLITADGIQTLHGPVMTSRSRPEKDFRGTQQWIDQIFVSDNHDQEAAWKEAMREAKLQLGDDPWHAMGSSKCGLHATVHIISGGKLQKPVKFEVTRMEVDPKQTGADDKPFIVAAKAWKKQSLMTAFDRQDFNSVAAIVCALDGEKSEPL
jgi:hypothetical protein